MRPHQGRKAEECAADVSNIAAEMIAHLSAASLRDCRSPGDAERAFEALRAEEHELFSLAEHAEFVFGKLRERYLIAADRAEGAWLDWQARREAKQILDAEEERISYAESK